MTAVYAQVDRPCQEQRPVSPTVPGLWCLASWGNGSTIRYYWSVIQVYLHIDRLTWADQ